MKDGAYVVAEEQSYEFDWEHHIPSEDRTAAFYWNDEPVNLIQSQRRTVELRISCQRHSSDWLPVKVDFAFSFLNSG